MQSMVRICWLLFPFAAVLGASQDTVESASKMDSARSCLMAQRYQTGERMLKDLCKQQPDNLEALYLLCMIKQTEILDYESYTVEGENFLACADSSLSVLTGALHCQKGKDSLDGLFYIGSILGGKGVIFAKNGNWPSAVRCALASMGYFKRIVKVDSNYYAAGYGMGVFKYYMSRNLHWLPFFGDKRPEALRQIRRALAAPFPYNYAACNSLCWILIERGEFAAADSLISEALVSYPDNTLFMRIKMRTALGLAHWECAESLSRRLIDVSLQRCPRNWADVVSGYQVLVCCYDNLHLGDACRDAARTALAMEVPEAYRKISFVKKHLSYIAGMRKKYSNGDTTE